MFITVTSVHSHFYSHGHINLLNFPEFKLYFYLSKISEHNFLFCAFYHLTNLENATKLLEDKNVICKLLKAFVIAAPCINISNAILSPVK